MKSILFTVIENSHSLCAEGLQFCFETSNLSALQANGLEAPLVAFWSFWKKFVLSHCLKQNNMIVMLAASLLCLPIATSFKETAGVAGRGILQVKRSTNDHGSEETSKVTQPANGLVSKMLLSVRTRTKISNNKHKHASNLENVNDTHSASREETKNKMRGVSDKSKVENDGSVPTKENSKDESKTAPFRVARPWIFASITPLFVLVLVCLYSFVFQKGKGGLVFENCFECGKMHANSPETTTTTRQDDDKHEAISGQAIRSESSSGSEESFPCRQNNYNGCCRMV